MREELCVERTATLRHSIERLHRGGFGVLLILDEDGKMVGLLTDGDLRKAILNNTDLEAPLENVMNKEFAFVLNSKSKKEAIQYLKQTKHRHMPVLDNDGVLVDILLLDELNRERSKNLVVLMAGGLGKRLAPITNHVPKPMCEIGDKPILQNIIENFIEYGFYRFLICVNYKAEMITEFFGDGSKWGVEIDYVNERQRLGTAGALSLLPKTEQCPVLVSNGDLVTQINLRNFLEYHEDQKSFATMAVRRYEFQVPFGVVEHDGPVVQKITEKPMHDFFVNAGIYILEPECLPLIPKDTYYDMTDLLEQVIRSRKKVVAFPVTEHWLDIGRLDDLKRAQTEFEKNRKHSDS